MKYHELCFLVIFLCFACIQNFVVGTHEEDSWIEPDAWSRERHSSFINAGHREKDLHNEESTTNLQCNIPKDKSDGEAIALMYYKRLIAYIFKSEYFKHDVVKGVSSRAFFILASPEQLDKLKRLDDPRDLDIVLSEILSKARVPTPDEYYQSYGKDGFRGRTLGFFALIWKIIKDLRMLLKITEVQFLVAIASIMLLGWYCHRRYKIGVITMIIFAVIGFGYFHTYLECNRKLEAERMLELLARNEQLNPPEPRWYTPLINFFSSSQQDAKQAERDYIKQASRLNLNFCRPDMVFLMYANDLFMKQLQFLIDKCLETITIMREDLPFPFNYLAATLLIVLIGYIIKLTFEHILSPNAWAGIWHAPRFQHRTDPSILSPGTAQLEDRISGENLRLLLNAFSGGSATTTGQIAITHTTVTAASLTDPSESSSGVQEILCTIGTDNTDSTDATASESSLGNGNEIVREDLPQEQNESTDNNKEKQHNAAFNDKSNDTNEAGIEVDEFD